VIARALGQAGRAAALGGLQDGSCAGKLKPRDATACVAGPSRSRISGYSAAVVGKLALWGLTGGIGSGKSTVRQMIAALGVPVLDADQIAREITAPGQPAHAEIARQFPSAIDGDGSINRKRLGALVFSDPAARKQLEAITHPRIQARAQELARALAAAGHTLAFYEASLLVETGRQKDFDGLVVVSASEERQLERAMARDGSNRDEILARVRAQLPLAAKREVANVIIDNDGDLATTSRQVEALVTRLRAQG
jgi:dephospho-CoA kinase